MAYQDFGGAQVTTLTPDEINAEAERIIKICDEDEVEASHVSAEAKAFFRRKAGELRARGKLMGVTVKQLFWLRDIKGQLE